MGYLSYIQALRVGEGGCGVVYRCDALPSLQHEGPFAVKLLSPGPQQKVVSSSLKVVSNQ